MRILIASVAAVLLLSGCSGDSDAETAGDADSSPTPSAATPSVEANASYGTVEQLRDAAVAAGYPCPAWKLENKVTLAAQSGQCSDADVFSTFASSGDLQSQLDSYKGTDDMLADAGVDVDPHLVGPNWIITGPGVDALQGTLGGTVVSAQ